MGPIHEEQKELDSGRGRSDGICGYMVVANDVSDVSTVTPIAAGATSPREIFGCGSAIGRGFFVCEGGRVL